jgi:class 3 adenylate cyclase
MASSYLDLRLDAVRAQGEFSADVLEQLKAFLEGAADEEVFRMSPLRYARRHGLAEQQAIDLFLHATHAGILEFAWGVLCPGCLAFLTTPGGLRSLHQKKRCNFCKIDIERPVDDGVEVAFTVAPPVRRVRFHSPELLDLKKDALRLFFSSSVAAGSVYHEVLGANILAAERVPAESVTEVKVTLGTGLSSLLAPGSHAVLHMRAQEGGPREISVELLDDRAIPEDALVAPGEVTLRILNRSVQPAAFVIVPLSATDTEQGCSQGAFPTYPIDPYLTGPRLISSQTFRELFRAESIPSEGGLELKSVTVLFTDLKGSTAIYERVGDLRAYDLVRKHFTLLRAIVASKGGAVVKTIGDAVMASFADPLDAVNAAIAMRREVTTIGKGDLLLKIGLHTGPCIAVELNDRLDYFGRTVNIAARVQALAEAGEIVCTEPVYEASGVKEAVAAAELGSSLEEVSLRGISDAVPVVRLLALSAPRT